MTITGDPALSSSQEPLLAVRHVSKHFGPIQAVDDVSLDIYPQEVVGLLGDNGAGKSTFLSVLTGYYKADSGQFIYKGKPVQVTSPQQSRNNLKIEMIYQNLRLAPDLTVSQNLFLGEELKTGGLFLAKGKMKKASADVLRKLNLDLAPSASVGTLSGGQQQAVAIGRALLFDRDIVLLDEPTAAISVSKVQDVLNLIKDLKAHGKTVILVSHRLEDILEVADRIVVFAHGRIRNIVKNEGLQISDLVHMMYEETPEERARRLA